MVNYLGETLICVADSPYTNYTPSDWALHYIKQYGQIDGEHHKQWVLDQVVRVLNGATIENMRLAEWDNGERNYRFNVGTSAQYEEWVEEMLERDENGEPQYSYDVGIPP